MLLEPVRSKHALIAEVLSRDIAQGKYRIGDLLPTESDLSTAFGVSRHTVRIALRHLQSLGLIEGQRGVGTVVRKSHLSSRYSHSVSSDADLIQVGNSGQPIIIDQTRIIITPEQAQYLNCKVGEHWTLLRTLRVSVKSNLPVAYSEIQIPLTFDAVIDDVKKSKEPIFSLIEKRFNLTISEIRQDLCAIIVSPEEAKLLQIPPKSAGLEITRRFIGQNGRVVGAARTIHPPKSFKYSMDVRRQHQAEE